MRRLRRLRKYRVIFPFACAMIKRLPFAFKYRIYPTGAQAACLTGDLGDACSLYHAAREERIGAWKICHKSINYYDQANQLKAMRADSSVEFNDVDFFLPNRRTLQRLAHEELVLPPPAHPMWTRHRALPEYKPEGAIIAGSPARGPSVYARIISESACN